MAQETPGKGQEAAIVEEKTELTKQKIRNPKQMNQSINTQVEFGNVGAGDKNQVQMQQNLSNLNTIYKDISSFTHSEDQAFS